MKSDIQELRDEERSRSLVQKETREGACQWNSWCWGRFHREDETRGECEERLALGNIKWDCRNSSDLKSDLGTCVKKRTDIYWFSIYHNLMDSQWLGKKNPQIHDPYFQEGYYPSQTIPIPECSIVSGAACFQQRSTELILVCFIILM